MGHGYLGMVYWVVVWAVSLWGEGGQGLTIFDCVLTVSSPHSTVHPYLTQTGKPRIKSHCKLYRAESQLHARINTMVMPTEPQYMVVNAQNNTIEVFDVSMGLKKGAKLVARLQVCVF